mmetsp:Transcript_5596/g.4269  ORF Transcript_5596/g.4269 Transcript_5596/m.4269 type:complete len:93 (-) Transcript_5596:99-377(-)
MIIKQPSGKASKDQLDNKASSDAGKQSTSKGDEKVKGSSSALHVEGKSSKLESKKPAVVSKESSSSLSDLSSDSDKEQINYMDKIKESKKGK